ncbi:MAG TPA: DUF4010 domain-containing protein [Gammaproteobacteria bacterium]|nr:DUF4010 domain-containing protein [Gammaproteobacteria bacterium]
MDALPGLGLALALGLLIGTERGWHERGAHEGARVAGIRTFGLVGLLGGLWALLARELGPILLGFAFLAFTALVIVAHLRARGADRDYGATTAVAALVAFALGALAVQGQAVLAAAGAVVTAVLLSLKPVLHGWLKRIEARELSGALKLLLISVVILPVLPDRGYGPWQALNPYQLWWLVVLIAAISFVGYVAVKMAGTRTGIILTALFGGIASSTATTLSLARLARNTRLQAWLALGVLIAAGTMFPRMLLEAAVVNPALSPALAPALGTMAGIAGAWSVGLWYRQRGQPAEVELPLENPFELLPALKFGVLLAAIMVLAKAVQAWLGDRGIYLLAGASGLADVDAITLSLADMARASLDPRLAVEAIVLAGGVNTLVKGLLVTAVAGPRLARRLVLPLLSIVLGGAAVLFLGR